jgi:5-oxopent-3-ene-1,2,5-tricarboxylate decarboxylase/2-hydroxyhepta-2,4-diene-1,7-dioate isomerase
LNPLLTFDMPPGRLSGCVVGTLLNHRSAIHALGPVALDAPYKGLPKAPVLFVKPANTLAGPAEPLVVPGDAGELSYAATLAILVGRPASRLTAETALEVVAGYTLVGDVFVPHDVFHRPSLRFNARDGFCRLGAPVVAASAVGDPNDLTLRTFVDGELVHTSSTADLQRDIATLLVDVTDFMTLQPGDLLLVGRVLDAPKVRAGQTVAIEADGIGRLETRLVAAADVGAEASA